MAQQKDVAGNSKKSTSQTQSTSRMTTNATSKNAGMDKKNDKAMDAKKNSK